MARSMSAVEHHRLVFADLRDCLTQACREVEAVARPIAGKVLCATVYGSSRLDETGTTDADEGSQAQAFMFSACKELLQHLDQFFHGLIARRLLAGVAPLIEFPQ
jgi:hypothetical protein